jgi:hypothetical protein
MNTQNLKNFIESVNGKLEGGNRVKIAVHSLRRYLEIHREESAEEISEKLKPFIDPLNWRISRTNWGFTLLFERGSRQSALSS